MVALICSRLTTTVGKPLGAKYVANLVTLGQKIRNRRLELRLLQKDIAERIGVCEDTITNWENGYSEPDIQYYPALIHYLGYIPFEIDTATLSGRIKLHRYTRGISQKELAKELGIDESTIWRLEKGAYAPAEGSGDDGEHACSMRDQGSKLLAFSFNQNRSILGAVLF